MLTLEIHSANPFVAAKKAEAELGRKNLMSKYYYYFICPILR